VADGPSSVVVVLLDDFLPVLFVGRVRRRESAGPPRRPPALPRLVRRRVERQLVRARRVRRFGRVARVLGLARDGRLGQGREADVRRGPFVTPADVRAVGNAGTTKIITEAVFSSFLGDKQGSEL